MILISDINSCFSIQLSKFKIEINTFTEFAECFSTASISRSRRLHSQFSQYYFFIFVLLTLQSNQITPKFNIRLSLCPSSFNNNNFLLVPINPRKIRESRLATFREVLIPVSFPYSPSRRPFWIHFQPIAKLQTKRGTLSHHSGFKNEPQMAFFLDRLKSSDKRGENALLTFDTIYIPSIFYFLVGRFLDNYLI